MTDTIRFKNPTEYTLRLEAVGLGEVEPGAEIDIPLHLCAPGREDGGSRKASPIESVAPQLVPVDEKDHKIWRSTPPPAEPISKVVSVNNNKPPTEAAGVKALRESLAAKKAQEVKASPQTKDKV